MPTVWAVPTLSVRPATIGIMPSSIAVIAIDAVEPRRVANFWCAVLGWEILEEADNGIGIGPPDGRWPSIDVLEVPEPKKDKNRLHFDLRADGATFDDELVRLEQLGARRVDVGQGAEVTWVVLADPEGNEFCLLRRTVQELR